MSDYMARSENKQLCFQRPTSALDVPTSCKSALVAPQRGALKAEFYSAKDIIPSVMAHIEENVRRRRNYETLYRNN